MKHNWKKNDDGTVDEFAWSEGFHNGVFCEDCGHTVCVICNPNYDDDDSCPGKNSTYGSVITTGMTFTAKDKLHTLRYKMIGVDLSRDGYIRLQNLDDGTETVVEPEWFRQKKIVIEQAI